jgi:putative membrane protein
MGTPDKDFSNADRKIQSIGGAARARNTSQHLSNERTYLAYIRTAIALIGFGVTTNRFSVFLIQSKEISINESMRWNLLTVERAGLGMVIFGMIVVIWAVFHYSRIRRQIERGDFQPDLRVIWTIAVVIVAGGGFSLLWLFHR